MSQIKIFQKAYTDLDNNNITLTVTDSTATNNGQEIVDYIRNRNNSSAWVTTGSEDAANTELEINLGDSEEIDTIILVGHNFKAFTIQYLDGGSYVDFSNPIAETTNSDDTTEFTFDAVSTTSVKLIITGTQIADSDKILKQLIITKLLRKLNGYPKIESPKHTSNRSVKKMLSGKYNYVVQVGAFECSLNFEFLKDHDDIAALETIHMSRNPYLYWLCGGNEDQFVTRVIGYRKEDFYLMKPSGDFNPQWYESIYSTGLTTKVKLIEVVD